jgi:hypothetical protein
MNGGTIMGNTSGSGGGVYVDENSSSFTMSGGTIRGNTASAKGGGVYVNTNNTFSGTFTKADADGKSGIIYGSDAGAWLRNTASDGHAVYYYISSSSGKTRNTTLGETDHISTSNLNSPPWD